MTVSNISEATGPMVTKFFVDPVGVEGTKFVQIVQKWPWTDGLETQWHRIHE